MKELAVKNKISSIKKMAIEHAFLILHTAFTEAVPIATFSRPHPQTTIRDPWFFKQNPICNKEAQIRQN